MAVWGDARHAESVLDSVVDVVVASSWVYALIVAIAALDAVFPVVPSEATVVAAAALAGAGELVFGLVVLAALSGAVIGDNLAYLLGRAGKGPLVGRLLRSPQWRARIVRAEAKLSERAGAIIVVSRFVPGGRTATMVSAGLVGLSWRRFAGCDLLAGAIWAGYAAVVGLVAGKAFADRPLHAILLAFGIAVALTAALEGGRRLAGAARRA